MSEAYTDAIKAAISTGSIVEKDSRVVVKANPSQGIVDEIIIPFKKLVAVDKVGAAALAGDEKALAEHVTYSYDLGVRSKLRQREVSKFKEPEKQHKADVKNAEFMVSMGYADTVEAGLAEIHANRAASA